MKQRIQHFSILRRWRTAMRDDSGVSAILIAILVVMVVIPISAIAVDLSNGYSNRRQMQNAADAASMAAADAFSSWRAGGANTLQATAERVAGANGGASVRACELVNVTYTSGTPLITSLGPCSSGTWGAANGVRVTTDREISTFFAPAMQGGGPESTKAGAIATASLQKVVGGWAPFALCSQFNPDLDGKIGWPIDPATSQPITILNPDDTINPKAIGLTFPIWGGGNETASCVLGTKHSEWDSSWKGLICSVSDFGTCEITLPGDVPLDHGAKTGPTLTAVAGTVGCTIDFIKSGTPCTLALPICRSRDKIELDCRVWGAFSLTYDMTGHGPKKIYGKLLGPATLSNAVGGAGDLDDDDSVVIGLVG